jgi:threonylcarbamoyladenosine tRNA methylthiotransferase MtaB
VVVNTCSVTASADQAARQTIRRVARLNPDAKIIVTGCYATRRPDEVASLPNVLRVVPNDEKPQLLSLLRPELSTSDRFGDGDGSCGAAIRPGVAGRTAFTLRVQTGCSEPCSYCIIPTTRGVPVSVPVERVLQEAGRVRAAGFKEIALTGVHLGSYGRDLNPRSSLIELLRALDEQVHGVRRQADLLFRISSLEPMDCTSDVVDFVAGSDRFAPHLHLPLQHASDRLLAAMRRPYTIAFYRDLVDRIRTLIPHASIGSDIIVGFPGETDSDFEYLAEYLGTSPLTHLHVFPYSDRPGTPAAALPNKVHGSIVRERANRLRSISQKLSSRFRQSQIGTVSRALTLDDGSVAVTGNYLKLRIPPGRVRNEWINVRMLSENHGELLGG